MYYTMSGKINNAIPCSTEATQNQVIDNVLGAIVVDLIEQQV